MQRTPRNEPQSLATDSRASRQDSAMITTAVNTDEKSDNAKSKLNEYAQNKRVTPYYETFSDNGEGFRSKVTILGKTFDSSDSYSTKKESMQMAAKKAMEYFNKFPDSSTCRKDSAEITLATNADGKAKNAKIMLIEYAQKKRAELPCYETFMDDSKGFRSKVTVLGKTFDSSDSYSTKKESTQMAAKKAMEYFSKLHSSTCRKDSAEITLATNADGKSDNAKSKLNEYAQNKRAKLPCYETFMDDGKGFRSKVTILGKTFDSSDSYSTKTESTQMVAKKAMEYFNSLSGYSNASPKYLHEKRLGQDLYSSKQVPRTDKYSSKATERKRFFKEETPKSEKEAENALEGPIFPYVRNMLTKKTNNATKEIVVQKNRLVNAFIIGIIMVMFALLSLFFYF